MPSWTSDAVVIIGDEDFDTEQFGIPAAISGLALSNITFNPGRTIETITGRLADERLHIGKTPVFTAAVTGRGLLNDGPLNDAAPFTPISRATFANYATYNRHGFPDTGSFVVTEVSDARQAGTFGDTTVTLKLVTSFTQAVTEVAA